MRLNVMLTRCKTWLCEYDYQWKFKLFVVVPIIVGLVSLDWITKGVISNQMQQGETKSFIPDFLSIQFYINLGSAYGHNDDPGSLAKTIALAAVITFFVLIALIFLNNKKWIIAASLMFAGSFANLLGRAWAPGKLDVLTKEMIYGGVVDMFHFEFAFLGSNEYIFNLADVWVSVAIAWGVVCFVWELVLLFTANHKQPVVDPNTPTNKDMNNDDAVN